MTAQTGIVWDERYFWHDTGTAVGSLHPDGWLQPLGHWESPESKRRILSLLDVSGLLDRLLRVPARLATEDELTRLHTPGYVQRIRELSEAGGGDGGDGETPFGRASYDIARLAVGGAIEAVDAVLEGRVRNAFALLRPPGHHALADSGLGFCLFGNTALAVHHALATGKAARVAVVDWDVHHGNGTQAAFYERGDVLTISLHQEHWFPPDEGTVEERGAGPGLGANVNVPLPAGTGHAAYLEAAERVVVPALRDFRPDLVVVASGLDASWLDPVGRMLLTSETFRGLTAAVVAAADELCGGRVAVIHEGGYSPVYVPFCALAIVEELAGIRTEVVDPYLIEDAFGVRPWQRAAVDAAAEARAAVSGGLPHDGRRDG